MSCWRFDVMLVHDAQNTQPHLLTAKQYLQFKFIGLYSIDSMYAYNRRGDENAATGTDYRPTSTTTEITCSNNTTHYIEYSMR